MDASKKESLHDPNNDLFVQSRVLDPTPSSAVKDSILTRMVDSFRRDPNQIVTSTGEIIDLKFEHGHSEVYDVESAIANTSNSLLSRSLKTRHLQMLAIGGSIGIYIYDSCTCKGF
jgi:amino acid transporter